MRRTVFHVLWGTVSVLQAALIAAAVVLSRLAYTKGGVNHHVAYRKRQYNELIFTPQNVLLMQLALLAIAVVLLWLLVRAVRQKRTESAVLTGCCVLLDGALLYELTAPAFQAIAIYPYAVFITALLFSLECALLALRKLVRE